MIFNLVRKGLLEEYKVLSEDSNSVKLTMRIRNVEAFENMTF